MQKQSANRKIDWSFDLADLEAKKCVVDLEREDNLVKSIQALRKFAKEVKIMKKI